MCGLDQSIENFTLDKKTYHNDYQEIKVFIFLGGPWHSAFQQQPQVNEVEIEEEIQIVDDRGGRRGRSRSPRDRKRSRSHRSRSRSRDRSSRSRRRSRSREREEREKRREREKKGLPPIKKGYLSGEYLNTFLN